MSVNDEKKQSMFRECAEDLRPMLWRITGAFVAPAEREDLLQEMLLQIWLGLPRFNGQSMLSTWAYRVGLNTAMRSARTERRHPTPEPLQARAEELAADDHAESSARLAAVYAALRQVTELDRAILLLALEETPRRKMAEILGISENAAQVRLHRARQRLNNILQEEPR